MPQLDKMALNEYLTLGSDYRKAANAVNKIYAGLQTSTYSLVLSDCAIETSLRKLYQRITELDNAVKRSNGNVKKLEKEIDKLRIDVGGLRNNLIEFLLTLRSRIYYFNGIFERTCIEYGLTVEVNIHDKSFLRWDHLRPDENLVLTSLNYIQVFSNQIAQTRLNYYESLAKIYEDLRLLGMKNLPALKLEKNDFQELRLNVDLILAAVDINGLRALTASISQFFRVTKEFSEIVSLDDLKVEVCAASAEFTLFENSIQFEKKEKNVFPRFLDMLPLADSSAADSLTIMVHATEISTAFETLHILIHVLNKLQICLQASRAFMIALGHQEKLDAPENYCKLAISIPADVEHISNYMAVTGTFKSITKGLELTKI